MAQASANRPTIDLTGKLAVVIGASEGIGAAIAVALAGAGARLVAGGRDMARMEPTLAAVAAAGGDGAGEVVDVREPDSVRGFASALTGRHGTPTILVNSMGGSLVKPMTEVAVAEWDNLFNTHLRGTFLACQAVAPEMAAAGYGKIINLSSTSALRIARLRGAYSVAKAGLNQLTSVLASEWGKAGIRVNAIAPSTTRTPRALAGFKREPGREAEVVARTPLGRIALPEDMVGPALFLASSLSDFVTGQTILVDGGSMTVR